MGIFRAVKEPQRKSIIAAATKVRLDNRKEAERERMLRQPWQYDAYVYFKSLGEIRYPTKYLANAASRMRLFVAALPEGNESDDPVDITNPETAVPPEIVEGCEAAIRAFGNGRTEIANHFEATSTNISLAGECYLLGQDDPTTGKTTYSIRTISEISVMSDQIKLREGPINASSDMGLTVLDTELTSLARMWKPDSEYRLYADSPMQSIAGECETLLILRRGIRAAGRSQIAGNGLLLVPEEANFADDNDNSGEAGFDKFINDFTTAMITPISDEGTAAAVVPPVIRVPGDAIAKFRHMMLAQQYDPNAQKIREETIGNIATGLDLPKEVLLGLSDINHWSAWQVDDNTFRNHIEPHVQVIVNLWTQAFLRPFLITYCENAGVLPTLVDEWLPRLLFWYDPTELVTKPDLTANATLAHAALVLSDTKYLEILGFAESDKPTPVELEGRMIRTMRTWPANVVMELLHNLDPELSVPPITVAGTVPGIKPGASGGADVALAPVAPTTSTSTDITATTPAASAPVVSKGPPVLTASDISELDVESRAILQRAVISELRSRGISLTASAAKTPKITDKQKRLSRNLTSIDRDLRAKVQAAANLEKGGTRARQKVARNETLKKHIAHTRSEYVMAALGKQAVEATGLTASDLMKTEWETLETQFRSWVTDAQKASLKNVAQLANISVDEATAAAEVALSQGVDAGWKLLKDSLDVLALHLAYNPDPNITHDLMVAAMNPDTLIPTGVVRCALAVAGGAKEQDFGLVKTISGAEVPAIPLGNPVGGLATGATMSGVLMDAGVSNTGYEWVHGPSDKPFRPHEDLDGVEFASFDDDQLANVDDFPSNNFLFPGDHVGCLCDFTPLWVSDQDVADAQAMADSLDAAE
jgi:hypothetical protein